MKTWSSLLPLSTIAAAGMTPGVTPIAAATVAAAAVLPRPSLVTAAVQSRPHRLLTRPISTLSERIIATAESAHRRLSCHDYASYFRRRICSHRGGSSRIYGLVPSGSTSPLRQKPQVLAQACLVLLASRYQFSTSSLASLSSSRDNYNSGDNHKNYNNNGSSNNSANDQGSSDQGGSPDSTVRQEPPAGSKPRMVTTSTPPHFDPIPYGFVPPEPKIYTTSTIHSPTSASPPSSPGTSEPKLKIIYSSAAEKAARAPPPAPPKGSWQHYRNKIFDLSGGDVREINIRTYMRWQFISASKIFGWMLVFSFFVGMFVYGAMNAYIELQEPTPSVFPEMIRVTMRWIYFHTEVNRDLPLAGLRGRVLMTELEADMNSKGGWEKCPVEWKRAYIDTCFRVANLFMALGKEDDAYIIYRRILAVEHEVVNAKRRSEAALKMGQCAIEMNKVDEGVTLIQTAVKDAVLAMPESQRPNINPEKPVLPDPGADAPKLPSELLHAVQALGIQYSRLSRPAESLPIFLSLLRTIQALPEDRRDTCREASVMAYLGEVIWTLGKQEEGLAWTKKALEESEKEAGERNSCRDCANYAVANAITMTKELGTKAKGMQSKEDVQNEVKALRSRENQLGRFGLQRKD